MCGTEEAVLEHVARSSAAQRVSVVGTARPRDVTSPDVTCHNITSPTVMFTSVVGTALRRLCFLSKSSKTSAPRYDSYIKPQ